MKIKQYSYSLAEWRKQDFSKVYPSFDLVLVFASPLFFQEPDFAEHFATRFPASGLIGCSSAGEILGQTRQDQTLLVTALTFEKTETRVAHSTCNDMSDSQECGRRLAQSLNGEGLSHVLLFSCGLDINGSELVKGLCDALPEVVSISGGLAGDDGDFQQTQVICNQTVDSRLVAAAGFYGTALNVGYGAEGGWRPFGPYRKVTRSDGNVLSTCDNRSALSLYQEYLGEHAKELPASGLLFPLSVTPDVDKPGVVRSLLGIDEEQGGVTFAGDVPEGHFARLMMTTPDSLIEAAGKSASNAIAITESRDADFVLLVSCIGRKMLLADRADEELESVLEQFSGEVPSAGFYSYGEISPGEHMAWSELHNQTMTVTTFLEE